MPDLSTVCEVSAPAIAKSAPALRHRLSCWLDNLSWPADDASDLLVAVNEAVTNVIDHAYPGPAGRPDGDYAGELVEVHAVLDAVMLDPAAGGLRWVRVTVRDRGRGLPTVHGRDDTGRDDTARHRGRGLTMIRALMDDIVISTGRPGGGTEVRMISPAVPLPARPDRR